MEKIQIARVLDWKYGPIASTEGDRITGWRHPSVKQPDEAQLEADRNEYVAYLAANLYKEKRSAEMPAIGDQLDALWKAVKALQVLAKVTIVDPEVTAIADSIQAVKDKYPKPIDKAGKIK